MVWFRVRRGVVQHYAPEDDAPARSAVLRADYQLANLRLRGEFPRLPGGEACTVQQLAAELLPSS